MQREVRQVSMMSDHSEVSQVSHGLLKLPRVESVVEEEERSWSTAELWSPISSVSDVL